MIIGLLLLLIISVLSKRLPPEINRCRLSDPKLADCMKINVLDGIKKFKDGNKDLGLISLNPLVIPKLTLGNSSSGAVAITQEYENLEFHDATDVKIDDMVINLSENNCYWKYQSHTPKIRMESDYKMNGKILFFPINGHGKCHNVLYDVAHTYEAKCENYTKKGKNHFRMTDVKYQIVPKKIILNYENIVDGNKQLSEEVLKTLNENADTVYGDVGPAFNEALGQLLKGIINQVFSRVPIDELFLP